MGTSNQPGNVSRATNGNGNRATNSIAQRSRSRKLLVRLLVLQPDLSLGVLASHLRVPNNTLWAYQCGLILMPLDVQERLSAFVIAHEPRLLRLAHRLRLQVEAARRYEAAEVVRHLTNPR